MIVDKYALQFLQKKKRKMVSK